MKATGIVRKLDELGRVVLPIELRRENHMDIRDQLEISVNGNEIILKKYVPRCAFCKGEESVKVVKGKLVCSICLSGLKSLD